MTPYLLLALLLSGDTDTLIVLHDGSRFRGELVEEIPNDHVTIKLATGDVKRFAWADIVENRDLGATAKPSEATAAVSVTVDIQSDRAGVVLFRRVAPARFSPFQSSSAAVACIAPCGTAVPRLGLYWIAGDSVTPSGAFEFGDDPRVQLDVRAGSRSQRALGWGLAIGGGAATLVGISLASVGNGPDRPGAYDTTHNQQLVIAGGITAAVGVALATTGLILMKRSATTVRNGNGMTVGRLLTRGLTF